MIRRISTINGDAWLLASYCTTCGSPVWEPAQWHGVGAAPQRSGCEHFVSTDTVITHTVPVPAPSPAPAPTPDPRIDGME